MWWEDPQCSFDTTCQILLFVTFKAPLHHLDSVCCTHQLYHSGVGSTVTALRQSYWIPTARQYVKSLLRRCVVCRKHSGKSYTAPDPAPNPAPLPKVRMQDTCPFSVTGVDFTGALYVYHRGEESKVYVYVHLLVPPVGQYMWRYSQTCQPRHFCWHSNVLLGAGQPLN